MGFTHAIGAGYRNIFNLTGRATRSAYWFFLWFLLVFVALIGVGVTLHQFGHNATPDRLVHFVIKCGALGFALLFFITGVSLLSLEVRRVRDAGQSGLWVLASVLLTAAKVWVPRIEHINPDSWLHVVLLVLSLAGIGVNLPIFIFLVLPSKQISRRLDW
jgi:uncharacterized membrane protein YhaH (DUF805 family)